MAFNLKKVLKAWLLSTSQPLSFKDIQATFTRFHEQVSELPKMESETAAAPGEGATVAPADEVASGGESEPAEVPLGLPADPELYEDVPSLVTTAQIREAMGAIAADLKAQDDGLMLIEGANGYRIVTDPRFGRWIRVLRQEPPPVKLSQSSLETLAVIAYRQPVTRAEIETIRGVSAEAGLARLTERELIGITGRAELPGRPMQFGTTEKFLEFVGIKSIDELPASDVLSSRQIDEWLKNSANPQKPGDREMGLDEEELPLEGQGSRSRGSTEPAMQETSLLGATRSTSPIADSTSVEPAESQTDAGQAQPSS